MRRCAKMRCEEVAAASVAVRYSDRTAIVEPLSAERDPNLLDLCEPHASSLTAPRGWRLVDQRPGAMELPSPVHASA
ncbi:MAG TPA: DUF3499 family protein [Actinomycetota bacterium]